MPSNDILRTLSEKHSVIVGLIGEQEYNVVNDAPMLPQNFSVQRKVVAVFGDRPHKQPVFHDFKITLLQKLSNVIDVSLDECLVPLIRNNVFKGHNDEIHVGIVQDIDLDSIVYDATNSTILFTATPVGTKTITEFASQAARVHEAVAPLGSSLGVRITLKYDICIKLDTLPEATITPDDSVVLRWGRCVESYTVAFTQNIEEVDTQKIVGVRLYLSSILRESQACTIGTAKRQSLYLGVESPPMLSVEINGLQIDVSKEDIISVELNHTRTAQEVAGVPMMATARGSVAQAVTRLSDHLLLLPSLVQSGVKPSIGSVFMLLHHHKPQATLVDIVKDRMGFISFVLRPCYINTDTLSTEALFVNDTQWTASGCLINGIIGISTQGSLPHAAMGENIEVGGVQYECTGVYGSAYSIYLRARRGGNPGPLYYDTLLDGKDAVYADDKPTQIAMPNEVNGHSIHCGDTSYTLQTANNPIGHCYRTSNVLVTVVNGLYTTMQYASAVSRTVNNIIATLDIGRTSSADMFFILFGTDGGGFTQLVNRSGSVVKSIHYRKRAHCRLLGLGTQHDTTQVALGVTSMHPETADPSAGVASRVVHIRILELEGVLCPPMGPWRSFVVPDTQTALTYASPHKEDTYASALAAQYHNATKRTLSDLHSLTIRLTDGDGIPLAYVPPGAIFILNISYIHAAIDGGSGPQIVF
jgi:hypothetical protein